MHNGNYGIAQPPPPIIAEAPERQILKARDPGRKKLILDTKRANPNMKASEIARIAISRREGEHASPDMSDRFSMIY